MTTIFRSVLEIACPEGSVPGTVMVVFHLPSASVLVLVSGSPTGSGTPRGRKTVVWGWNLAPAACSIMPACPCLGINENTGALPFDGTGVALLAGTAVVSMVGGSPQPESPI